MMRKLLILVLMGVIVVLCGSIGSNAAESADYFYICTVRITNAPAGTYMAFIGNETVCFQTGFDKTDEAVLKSNRSLFMPTLMFTRGGNFTVLILPINQTFDCTFKHMYPAAESTKTKTKPHDDVVITTEDVVITGSIAGTSGLGVLLRRRGFL